MMSRHQQSTRPKLPIALLLCSGFLAHSAVAQTAAAGSGSKGADLSGELETIVVTARKIGEDIQSIPESITAIDANTIANAHLTKLEDLNSVVTNVNIVQRADNTPDVVLR